jgi:D-cysteine desulfhydrase
MTASSRGGTGIEPPSRVSLGCFPTRIETLGRAIARRDGALVRIKRDDQTGSDLSGNKVRKLEFLLAEALAEQCDIVITCGGIQSNHCRATAIAARRLGMDSLLFLRGESPSSPDGNLFLDLLVGAHPVFITPEEYGDRTRRMAAEAERLSRSGRRPYVIPEGGSNALGAWGYIEMLRELREQGFGVDRRCHLFMATGSAGTLAGLEIGARLLSIDARPWGVAVCDDEAYFRNRVMEIAGDFFARFGFDARLARDEIRVLEGYRGPGYAKTYPRLLEMIGRLAREEGILLDPVYTGKAFLAMVDLLDRNEIPPEDDVVFVHTGGIFSLFAYRDELLPGPAS